MVEKVIKVLLADRFPIFRDGLKYHLEKCSDIEVIGESGCPEDTVSQCSKSPADVILADVDFFCAGEGLTISQMIKSCPDSRVLITSLRDDPLDIQIALSEGAVGYIMKVAKSSDFVDAIRVIGHGGSYLPTHLMSNLIEAANKTRSSGNMFGLTARETEILRQLALGFCNKEIARKFSISVRTVETHRQNVRQKTGTFSTADLVRIAVRLGLTRDVLKKQPAAANVS